MLGITDLKIGSLFADPKNQTLVYIVLAVKHSKQARGGAVLTTKLRNIQTNQVLTKTFRSSDKFEEADIEKTKVEFLYKQNNTYHFLDNQTFEQVELNESLLLEQKDLIKEGLVVQIVKLNSKPISIELPIKVSYKVISAPPSIKNATADSGSTKRVAIETGLEVEVPMFIKADDEVVIDTRNKSYIERG